MKSCVVVGCLFFAGLIGSAQEKSAVDSQNPSARTLYWNDKPNMKKWLTDNESVLLRGDACALTFGWWDEEHPDGPRSATHNLVNFVALPTDEESTSVIHDPQSGLDIRIGVRYVPGRPKASSLLQLALAFEGPPNGVFDEVSRSQAESLRYPGWKFVGVEKATTVNRMRYTFRLNCQNGPDYLNTWLFSRRHSKPPK